MCLCMYMHACVCAYLCVYLLKAYSDVLILQTHVEDRGWYLPQFPLHLNLKQGLLLNLVLTILYRLPDH